MKILKISNGDFFSTYGGGQVYVRNLVDEMISQGIDIIIFSFVKKHHEIIVKKDYNGIDLYEIADLSKEKIKELLLQIKPDIVHAHAQKAFFSVLCKELNIPYVVTAHHGGITCPAGTLLNHRDEICHVCVNDKDCLPCVMRNTWWGLSLFYPWMKFISFSVRLKIGHWLSKRPFMYFVTPIGNATLDIQNKKKEWATVAENTDLMIAPSEAIAENMILNGLHPEKIRFIPHGIPINYPSNSVVMPQKKTKFFYVGRICYVKGIHVLLKAFTQLNSNVCELHLIGDISGKYERMLINQYRSYDHIFFHGKIPPEKVSERIQQYDILVHPAIYLEVFGLNIAEALSQGKPVIATRCGGAEMQIRNGENGILVEPNNVDELQEVMRWSIEHPNKIREMSEKTIPYVVPIKDHVHKLVQIYKELQLQKMNEEALH